MDIILNIILFIVLLACSIQFHIFLYTSTFITDLKKMIKVIFLKSVNVSIVYFYTNKF